MATNSPPKKKPKIRSRNCVFNQKWLVDPIFKDWIYCPQNENQAGCTVCKTTFSIKHDGRAAVNKHNDGKDHARLLLAAKSSNLLTKYYPTVDTTEEKKVIAVELAKTYHNVRHGLSYLSGDCGKQIVIF